MPADVPFVIAHALDIAAPVDVVWQVITDLPTYPQWNPFVVACRSTLAVGDPIAMRVRLFATFAQSQREVVLEHEPGRRLCYGLTGGALRAIVSRRSHEVQALSPTRTRYESRFELSGWLAFLVRLLLGDRLVRGFTAMSAALERRAVGLHGGS